MSSDAILLRPLGQALSRRVAAALAATFGLVLLLAWLAARSLVIAPAEPAAATAPRAPAQPAVAMLAPAGILAFHVAPVTDPQTPAAPLEAPVAALLAQWSDVLRARPDSRVVLTLAVADGTAPLVQQRMGAALVRVLVGSDLNPHRVQLVLAPSSSAALSPGDFRLSIEMGRP